MGFFDKLFGKKKQTEEPKMSFPLTIEIITNTVYVKVFKHLITTEFYKEEIPCLVYLTQGMETVGQQELLLVLANVNNTEHYIPDSPLRLFQQIYAFAQQGTIAVLGDRTQFGEFSIMGWKGIIYGPPVLINTQEALPEDYLTMIMLHQEEIEAYHDIGPQRIMSMLGNQFRYYPFPYWADTLRKKLPVKQVIKDSITSKTPRMLLPNSTITLINKHLYFTVPTDDISDFKDLDCPSNQPITIFLSLDETANACLTWPFDDIMHNAIKPDGSDASRMGGCFLLLCGDQQGNTAKIAEDGFGIMMTTEAWNTFWQALKGGTPFHLPLLEEEIRDFSIDWK